MADDKTLIEQAISAHSAAGPPPRSFGEATEWSQRLDMTPSHHLVHAIYTAALSREQLPGGEALFQRVVRTARSAGIAEDEIEAAIAAAT